MNFIVENKRFVILLPFLKKTIELNLQNHDSTRKQTYDCGQFGGEIDKVH